MNDPVSQESLEPLRITRLDVIVFLFAFLGGAGLYLAFRTAGLGQAIQTSAILAIMLTYAAAVYRVPRLRVRLDQAGDNAYYLGLLFTLMSMAVALYEFRAVRGDDTTGRAGAEHIISNFGIALASTIAGIFLRVILSQMRVDPADVESMTRIELSLAATKVKASLDSVTGDLAAFHNEVRQRMSDVLATLTADYSKTIEAFTVAVNEAATRVLEETEKVQSTLIERSAGVTDKLELAAESARAAIERLSAVELPPTKLATRLNKVCESLERMTSPIDGLSEALRSTGEASAAAARKISSAAEQLATLEQQSREQQTRALRNIEDAAQKFEQALARAGDVLQQDKALLEQLEAQARKSSHEAARAREASNAVLTALTEAARELKEIIQSGGSSTAPAASVEPMARPGSEAR